MKKIISITLVLLASVIFQSRGAYNYEFSSHSVLASGKWVKVKVNTSGLYEIDYDRLKEMGFENPSNVGVYGTGGITLSQNFTDLSGNRLYEDNLLPVAVYHKNSKLYFYGVGSDNVIFNPSNERNGKFQRIDKNIYTDSGFYFLTDNGESPRLVKKGIALPNSSREFDSGYGFVYHELDLKQNTTSTGNIFWGEDFPQDGSSLEWEVSFPFANDKERWNMECLIYASSASSGRIRFGLEGTQIFGTYQIAPPSSGVFRHQSTSDVRFDYHGESGKVFMDLTGNAGDFVNLDYWIVTYSKSIPDMSLPETAASSLIGLETVKGENGYVVVSGDPENLTVFDISDPVSMEVLEVFNFDETNAACFKAKKRGTSLIFADLSKPQLQIEDFSTVANTDLHALRGEGYEMAIVTIPSLKTTAEKIAELHERYDGVKVLVTDTETLFNEFSSGSPAPIAYRALTKLLYNKGDSKFRNLLILGPETADMRSTASKQAIPNVHIGFQENQVSGTRDASNALDFYGMASDYLHLSYFHEDPMEVGVGIMSLRSEREGERAVAKIEKYLAADDCERIVNEFAVIGGTGDNHTHDRQAIEYEKYINNYAPARLNIPKICLDAYGSAGSRDKLMSEWNNGKLLTTYFGHGSQRFLNKDYSFLCYGDLKNLANAKSGIMFIFGCDISKPDLGERGIGEALVLDSEHGMVATVISSRTTWSGQNYDLGRKMAAALFRRRGANTEFRSSSPTIGEVYADAKTASTYSNELCYFLVGDPALRVPVALRKISLNGIFGKKFSAGEKVEISGIVAGTNGLVDTRYNGRAVLRMMAPGETLEMSNCITGEVPASPMMILYDDNEIATYETEVKDGRFTFTLIVPREVDEFGDGSLPLYCSAYDKERQLGAAGYSDLMSTALTTGKDKDEKAPEISVEYDAMLERLQITVTDDNLVGNSESQISATIDGLAVNCTVTGSPEASDWSVYHIFTDMLAEGEHKIDIEARDIAGNIGTTSSIFNVNRSVAPLILMPETVAVVGTAAFDVEGTHGGLLTLTIVDNAGKKIFSGDMEGWEGSWDCRDSDGNKVAPGHYKAMVKEKNADGVPRYSEWVHFGVLE